VSPPLAGRSAQQSLKAPWTVAQSGRHKSPHLFAVLSVPLAQTSPGTDDADRQDLLLRHLPQVRLVAKSIWDRLRFTVELDDLIGYGMIGLMKALERFDSSRGILLKTYAEHRIRGAILDGLREMDWLPRSARQEERQRSEEQQQREALAAAPPSKARNGSCGTGVRRANHGVARPPASHIPHMAAVFSRGNLADLEKLKEAPKASGALGDGNSSPEHLYERKEKYDRVADAMACLPWRQQQIIELYYRSDLSMKEIGKILRVHESRVSQLHAGAIQQLRKQLAGQAGVSPISCKIPLPRYS